MATSSRSRRDNRWTAPLVTVGSLLLLAILVLAPLAAVLVEAFSPGLTAWWQAVSDTETVTAVKLSLFVAAFVVPLNTAFGVAAAWLLARFRFPGRATLLLLLDLPLSVSPVVAGLIFVLLFGAQGLLGPWLMAHDIQIIFAVPGIVLATAFVTLPMVVRELLPILEAQGEEEELAAVTLGASGWQLFTRVTLPRLKSGLVYGVLLCTARTLGEFGAVSVVSGHIRGQTETLPLHVEILHAEYQFHAAFAAASLLLLVGVATLLARRWLVPHKHAATTLTTARGTHVH